MRLWYSQLNIYFIRLVICTVFYNFTTEARSWFIMTLYFTTAKIMIEKQKTSKDITALMWRTCAILTTTNIIKSQYYILQTRPICRITSNTSYISIHARLSKYMSCLSFYAQCFFFFMFVCAFIFLQDCNFYCGTTVMNIVVLRSSASSDFVIPKDDFIIIAFFLCMNIISYLLNHRCDIARPSPSKCGFISVDSSFSCFM